VAGSDVVESKSMLVMAPGSGAFSAVLHRLAAERAEADGMLQDAFAPIFQNGSRYREHMALATVSIRTPFSTKKCRPAGNDIAVVMSLQQGSNDFSRSDNCASPKRCVTH